MVIALLAWALAAEPEPPPDDVDEAVHEIVVHGELLAEQARQEVLQDLADAGYTWEIRKDDYLLLRHPDPWKGEVRVYDDGWVLMKRQPMRIEGREMPWAKRNSALAWAGCAIWPWMCIRSGGALVSDRKMMGQRVRTLAPMDSDIDEWGDRVADVHVDRRASQIPARLEALWFEGTPLVGTDVVLVDPQLRKDSLLDYWESRTDTPWGDQIRAVVEAFIREEVQYSAHPFSPEEIAAFNRRAHTERVLDLDRPWDELLADLEGPEREMRTP